jgi:hypothetical protein
MILACERPRRRRCVSCHWFPCHAHDNVIVKNGGHMWHMGLIYGSKRIAVVHDGLEQAGNR